MCAGLIGAARSVSIPALAVSSENLQRTSQGHSRASRAPPLLQVGTSLCHFLTLTATFDQQPAGGGRTAEVLLQFGSLDHLQRSASSCVPAEDATKAAAAATAPGGPVEWPDLASIEVLGWHLPAEGAAVEVVQRADTCGGLAVVQRLALPAGAVGAGSGGLKVDLSGLGHLLECPYGLRVRWSSESAAVA